MQKRDRRTYGENLYKLPVFKKLAESLLIKGKNIYWLRVIKLFIYQGR